MTAKKYADIELRLYELFEKNKMTNGFVKVEKELFSTTIMVFSWIINT